MGKQASEHPIGSKAGAKLTTTLDAIMLGVITAIKWAYERYTTAYGEVALMA